MSINFKTKCSSLANKWNYSIHMRPLFTDLNEAVREVKKRKTDPKILSKIANFLDGDVPVHFNQSDPVFYLSRHLGSPNFEAIKAYEMTKNLGYSL